MSVCLIFISHQANNGEEHSFHKAW